MAVFTFFKFYEQYQVAHNITFAIFFQIAPTSGEGAEQNFHSLSPYFSWARKEPLHSTKSRQNYAFVMQNSVHSAKNISRLKNVPSDLDYTKLIVLPFTKNFNLFDVTQFQQSRCDLRDIVRLIRSRVGIKIKNTHASTQDCVTFIRREIPLRNSWSHEGS